MTPNDAIEVLLVEDDPGDVELTRESLDMSKLKIHLHVVHDGEKAMAMLRKEGEFAGAATPDVVILDLNLPRKGGHEVLADMKASQELRDIPVVVLTTSDAEDDIGKAYATGASCYITKPIGLEEFSKVVQSIQDFWFTVVKLPRPRD